MNKKIIIFLLLAPLVLTGQACQLGFGGKKQEIKPDAGVFKTADAGVSWKQIAAVPSISGSPGSIGRVSVGTVEVDPQDNKAIYLGTDRNGIYYTYDGGVRWNKMSSFPKGKVYSIKIDSTSKCIIYATHKNSVRKTTDCGRNWSVLFVADNAKTVISALAIDFYNTNIVYAATSGGVIYKSFDSGATWSTPFNKISANIVKFLMDPYDSRIIYAATKKKGIFKTTDAGINWVSLAENLKQFKGYNDYRGLFFNPSKQNSLILVSKYGLLKTEDGGEIWSSVPLLTSPGAADIRAATVDPKDDQILYYSTRTTFYKTINNGSDWETKKLFSTKLPTFMIHDPEKSGVIYMTFNYPASK
ncbi:hypothetical protein HOD96_00445 [Candidatus Falkowbacteria bacterium]|jgi:photosystem II stability/assembly factor-like uncharacterized protein|nr:hypothetical protein [Candidatus Falkowbacteria bacterium]MBT4433293.1 hypothetical protein [Candidatus Falkowbacteria bacterium]